ncbi:LysR family transcriptional regulator [Litorimonas taeanensis]|uniref:LysR family transcriptional regulator n=1 Tax=Litorimonas taeanensis TaxID=568099 RepID=A0A420WDW0_9PROT|nr:LysR family transcriptional regulator [Litorimonas taeanensis]RKQ69176.1 LysR family transcriptional regulator [Litorimonas taeanensis]
MSRNNFGDIRIFVQVARMGGFRAAAKQLRQAPASVSEAVQRLEDRIGVKLFERSTRSVALTQVGEQLYTRSLPAVKELEEALSDIDVQKDEVAGTLKLSAPYSAGPFFLDNLIAKFATLYPTVDVEIIYDDNKVDLVTSGIDAAIRSNTLLEPDTHAVTVGPALTMSIIVSQDYLTRKGTPKHPQDIINHDTLCYAFGRSGQLAPWSFNGPDGVYTIQPKPRIAVNDMRSLLHYAEQGLGLAYVYKEIAAPFLKSGKMKDVLNAHLTPFPRYSLNYLSKRHMPRRLRAFIDMAKESTIM